MASPDKSAAPVGKVEFFDVVVAEAKVVTSRRRRFGGLGETDGLSPWDVRVDQLKDEQGHLIVDGRGERVPCTQSERSLVGLSFSGGGVRSASFCLGVLQGLDAVVPDDAKPQVLDAVDYVSTVSGGGYIGTSLVAAMTQESHGFPFTSKLDQMETLGTQHLRDFSSYLAPSRGLDYVVSGVVLLRGLLINALLVFGIVFVFSAATVLFNPDEGRLGGAWIPLLGWVSAPFVWTGIAFAVFILLQLPVVAKRIGFAPSPSASLDERERIGKRLAYLLLALGAVTVLDVQSFVLKGMFDAVHLGQCRVADASGHLHACPGLAEQTGWLGRALSRIGLGSGAPWGSLTAAVAALGVFGSKLVKVASATFGDQSWSGLLKHWGSRIAVALGSLIVPLALWAVYLSLCFAAIQCREWPAAPACCNPFRPPNLPIWAWRLGQHGLMIAYGALGGAFLIACLFIPTNANSLHGYYRDRLSRAFLWNDETLKAEAEMGALGGRGLRARLKTALQWIRAAFAKGRSAEPQHPPTGPDATKLSQLLPGVADPKEKRPGASRSAPYLVINTAVNLEGSKYANRRGRNAESFTFSPLHSGSSATGYVATSELEKVDPHLDLATAMAISGAAASANMGASTIRPLTFSLAVLNVRLGYWLPNPRRLAGPTTTFDRWRRLWPVSFALEAMGRLSEETPLVYLTDGGHFDNLGIYELLKRRCKIIVTADAEADPPMNFESLIRLERCARIDLGVRIDLPWEDLRRWSRKITVDDPHGPDDDPAACVGPHVALGRILYTDDDIGVLIYIKSCISGDENDLIRDYRRRNPDFPHETTLDQFFTEEQFEVYRALGFHATHSFFTGRDRFGFRPSHADRKWTALVRRALTRLNIPDEAVDTITARQAAGPGRTA